MTNETNFKKNQKVQDRLGRKWTVALQVGCSVYMYEDSGFAPIHPKNLKIVK